MPAFGARLVHSASSQSRVRLAIRSLEDNVRLIRRALVPLAAAAAIVAAALPATAITGGQSDGEGHPNVGMLLYYADDNGVNSRFRCSGSLVSPTVILTAGHCTAGTEGKTLVTFSTTIAEVPPSGLPRAGDDTGTGTSVTGFTGVPAVNPLGFHSGTAYTHPEYSDFTDTGNWNDVGVIVLDSPVEGIVPADIAPLGYLDAFAQPALNKTLFTFVGYGTNVTKPDSGPQKPQPMSYPLIRRTTDSQGQKLTPQILQVNGNPNNVIGGGGTCFGDSGGPAFLNGLQVTVTSYGYTSNCRYLGGHQRVDIPVVQSWLATFGVTP